MNITEMHLAVQQGVDKINSFQADTLLPQEIDLELNKAIDKFINLKYGKNNLYGKGFEESQKRVDDLRAIVKTEKIKFKYLEESVHNSHVYFSDELPSDYRYLVKTLCTVYCNKSCSTLTWQQQILEELIPGNSRKIGLVSAKFVQHDDIHSFLADPFNTTKRNKPLIVFEGNGIKAYTNDIFIIDSLKLTYIKNPAKVSLSLDTGIESVDCELAEHTHQEIVDMTINSILEGISDLRYKTQQIELGKNE
tara:strand:+ start:91318 stop:92067 length:750 start_codon:yes stop_codon:yes gene_type:complete